MCTWVYLAELLGCIAYVDLLLNFNVFCTFELDLCNLIYNHTHAEWKTLALSNLHLSRFLDNKFTEITQQKMRKSNFI